MRHHVFLSISLFLFVLLYGPRPCHAQWTKDVDCAAGTIYEDVRIDAGRQEFCERLQPGALKVKDGPFRSWFSEGNPGDEGVYKDGRQVGLWKKCTRFGKCSRTTYELVFPYEKERPGFRREIPVSFQNGKYIFDFTSCWSTWVVQSGGEELNLNIGSTPYRCNITYIPKHVLDSGGEGSYFCRIPFSVGTIELRSLDLQRELPKLSLPQFCRSTERTPDGEDFALLKDFTDVVAAIDVQSTTLSNDSAGHEFLTFTLNHYATDLAVEVATREGPLTTRVCGRYDQPTEISRNASGHTSFKFRISDDHVIANEQKRCVSRLLNLGLSLPAQTIGPLPITIEVKQNVEVTHNTASHEFRGRLYLEDAKAKPFRLTKGQRFQMVQSGHEGSCRIRFNGNEYGLTSCPWLEGFSDHQADVFVIVPKK
jgi:hypothetical protein